MSVSESSEPIDFGMAIYDSDRCATGYENVTQVRCYWKVVRVLARTQDSTKMKIREASGMEFEFCDVRHCLGLDFVDFFNFNQGVDTKQRIVYVCIHHTTIHF